jgi:hypothetical protein
VDAVHKIAEEHKAKMKSAEAAVGDVAAVCTALGNADVAAALTCHWQLTRLRHDFATVAVSHGQFKGDFTEINDAAAASFRDPLRARRGFVSWRLDRLCDLDQQAHIQDFRSNVALRCCMLCSLAFDMPGQCA